jgi:hypothetical protein
LPDDKGDRVGEAMYGVASKVVDRTNLRAAIATNFTKSGSLSDSRTEQCRLTIRYGVVMKGRSDDWERTIDLNIPTYSVWDDAVAT